MTRRHLLAAAVLAALASRSPAHPPREHGFSLVVFDRALAAPGFELARLGGGRLGLASLRGRHAVVNFWATWCPPCVRELRTLQALDRHFRGRLSVVGVASDPEGPAVVTPFVDRLGITFPILLDRDGGVSRRYGARELPVTFLLDPRGRVTAAARGERDWGSSRALGYLNEVLAGSG